MIDLQEAIRKERTARGLSQEQLGALVGVSGSSIGSYEAGRLIPVPAIAKALDGVFETGDRIQRLAAQARGQCRRHPVGQPPTTDGARCRATRHRAVLRKRNGLFLVYLMVMSR